MGARFISEISYCWFMLILLYFFFLPFCPEGSQFSNSLMDCLVLLAF